MTSLEITALEEYEINILSERFEICDSNIQIPLFQPLHVDIIGNISKKLSAPNNDCFDIIRDVTNYCGAIDNFGPI